MTKIIPTTLQPSRDGDHFLVTIPNHWGRGATLAEAKAACKKASYKPMNKWKAWRVYSVHPETYLDDMGYLRYPKGHTAIVLAEHNPE